MKDVEYEDSPQREHDIEQAREDARYDEPDDFYVCVVCNTIQHENVPCQVCAASPPGREGQEKA